MKLKTQFLLFFNLFAILSLSALTMIILGITVIEVRRNTFNNMDNTAAWVLQNYRNYMINIEMERKVAIENYLTGIAEDLWFQVEDVWKNEQAGKIGAAERDRQIRRIILSARVRQTGYAFGMNTAGVLVIHPLQPGRDLSSEPHIKEMMRKKNGWISYKSITADKEKIVVYRWFEPLDLIIAPGVHREEMTDLYNREQEKVLYNDMVRLITETRINTGGFLIICSPAGSVLLKPENCPLDTARHFNHFLDGSLTDFSGTIPPWRAGMPYYIYPASPETDGNRILVFLPQKQVFDYLSGMLAALVIVVAGTSALVLVIGIPLTNRITRPLTVFAEKADRLATGDYDLALPDPGSVLEIRQLGNSLYRMAETIRQRDRDMESRVADRTRRLEALFSVSQRMIQAQELDELLAAVVEGFPIPALNRAVLVGVQTTKKGVINSIVIKATWYSGRGTPPQPPGTEFPPEVARAMTPFFKRDPVTFRDAPNEPGAPDVIKAYSKALNLKGVAGFPLWYKKKLVGVLFLESEEVYDFTQEELRPYHSTLGQLTAAVENQFLIRELSTAKELAEQASDAKSLFLANISHELRTPLNAILGFSRLMRDNMPDNEKKDRYLDIILQSGNHLLNLINDILDISRIEAGRINLEPVRFDAGRLMSDVQDMIGHRIHEKGLAFIIEKDPSVPPVITADFRKLNQILVNLIGNAIKYTETGYIRLTAKMTPALPGSPLHLCFEVEDTGIGIPEEDHERIFQPFEQIGKNRTARGTGLGLAISLQYARLMKGTLSVESTPGSGALFRLEIPLD
jgi:signal transduction histidine kinase/HAMP domain-containing protein